MAEARDRRGRGPRFYEHRGVDVRGILRAVKADITNRGAVQGGSTITQQFVKNAINQDERTISRKLREAALAWRLERTKSKDWILDRVPQHGLLRERRVRRRAGVPHLLQAQRRRQ